MSELPSAWRLLQDFGNWISDLELPLVSLAALIAAFFYALAGGFTVGRVSLIVLCAIVAGFRYLRIKRGSLKVARMIAAENARTRRPIPEREIPLRVCQSLLDNEQVIVQTRLHPIVTIKWWLLKAVAVALVPLALALTGGSVQLGKFSAAATQRLGLLVLALIVLSLGYTTYKLVDWSRSRLYVTDSRILFLHGVFTMALAETPIVKVTDKETEDRFFPVLLARLRIIWLPYGRLNIETAGQKQWISVLGHIPNVMMVGKIISQYASGTDQDTEPPPPPQRHDRWNNPV